MGDRQPHPNSTGWTMDIPQSELERLMAMMFVCRPRTAHGQYVSVGRVDCTTRRWVFEAEHARTWVDAPCDPLDPEEPVRLPRHFIDSLMPLADSLGSVLIYRDRTTGQFVGVSGNDMVACDPWDDESGEFDDIESMGGPSDSTVSAVVSMETVRRISSEYGTYFEMAFGRTASVPPAFTGITVADGRFSWISDWSRWHLPKQSGAAEAETTGAGSVGFLADVMWRTAVALGPAGTATISWNGECPTAVRMIGDDWGVECEVHHEMMFRYRSFIDSAFSLIDYKPDLETEFDVDTVGVIGPRMHFEKDGRTVTASVFDAGPSCDDYVRIVTRVATADVDIPAVRAEIDRVNESLVGAKLLVIGKEIFVAVEFSLRADHEMFGREVALLEASAAKCDGLEEFLPLFSQT